MAHLSRIVFPTSLAPIAYDPASQIATESRDNDAYSFVKSDGATTSTSNGLNELASVNGAAATYDANGNMTFDPATGRTFTYDSQNQLVSSTLNGVTASLTYDPLGRLYQLSSPSGVRRFLYSTDDTGTPEPISEYDTTNNVTIDNLYGYGPGPDEPVIWWDGAVGLAQRNLQADERGSIVAVTDASGNPIGINAYDEYGVPQGGSITGKFGYTGQLWLPEVGLYDHKNRMYLPGGGVFLQTDPVGYAASANPYPYVLNDPVNLGDPLGLEPTCPAGQEWGVPTGTHIAQCFTPGDVKGGIPATPPNIGGGVGSGTYIYEPGAPTTVDANGDIVVTGGHWVFIPNINFGSDYGLTDNGETFGCLGGNFFAGAGLCRASGRTYAYFGLHYPPGLDVTAGRIYGGSQNFLTGFSAAGNGLPGGGLSLDSHMNVQAVSFQIGTPGGGLDYGFDITDAPAPNPFGWLKNVINVFSNGFYNLIGRPYDPPR